MWCIFLINDSCVDGLLTVDTRGFGPIRKQTEQASKQLLHSSMAPASRFLPFLSSCLGFSFNDVGN